MSIIPPNGISSIPRLQFALCPAGLDRGRPDGVTRRGFSSPQLILVAEVCSLPHTAGPSKSLISSTILGSLYSASSNRSSSFLCPYQALWNTRRVCLSNSQVSRPYITAGLIRRLYQLFNTRFKQLANMNNKSIPIKTYVF